MCPLSTKWGGNWAALLNIRDTYFPQTTQTHKYFFFKYNFDKLTNLLGEIVQCASQQQDVWPVAQEKGSQWRTHIIVNTTYIYVYLFSLLYINYVHIITTRYIYIIWHLQCLYSFGTSVSVMFTVHFLLFILLLWMIYFTCSGNVINICVPCQ